MNSNTTTRTQLPQRGDVIPDFTLDSPDGQSFSSRSLYMRRRLVIVLLPESNETGWIDEIGSAVGRVKEADAHFVLIAACASAAAEIAKRIAPSPGMTIVQDPDELAARRFGFDRRQPALLITDQYGVVYHVAQGQPGDDGLHPAEIPAWVELIACRCS